VIRGGSWLFSTNSVRSSYRSNITPDYTYDSIGFRVAKNP
jgi:formylglycine-generating enzyme required for sulfatase activity